MSSTINTYIRRLWLPTIVLMAITGMGQMPIFKRYYVADIPGLAWLGEPFTVHWVHYGGAALLMFMMAWYIVTWLAQRNTINQNRDCAHSTARTAGYYRIHTCSKKFTRRAFLAAQHYAYRLGTPSFCNASWCGSTMGRFA